MPEPASSITFPYACRPDEHHLTDVAFGRSCVAMAMSTDDPETLGHAIEALARAVNAEMAARLALVMATPAQHAEISAAFGPGGARG